MDYQNVTTLIFPRLKKPLSGLVFVFASKRYTRILANKLGRVNNKYLIKVQIVLNDHFNNKDVTVLIGTLVKSLALMTRQRETCWGAFYIGEPIKGDKDHC